MDKVILTRTVDKFIIEWEIGEFKDGLVDIDHVVSSRFQPGGTAIHPTMMEELFKPFFAPVVVVVTWTT